MDPTTSEVPFDITKIFPKETENVPVPYSLLIILFLIPVPYTIPYPVSEDTLGILRIRLVK